jgi:hypothetical protein
MSEIMRFMDASRQGINVKDYAGHAISFLCMPPTSSDSCLPIRNHGLMKHFKSVDQLTMARLKVHSVLQIICADFIETWFVKH